MTENTGERRVRMTPITRVPHFENTHNGCQYCPLATPAESEAFKAKQGEAG